MPHNKRERSDLTKQIRSILDGYPFGIAILRELLQNSDDAKAQNQTFILDCRTHGTSSLENESLGECQGPALLAVNDAVFRDPEDWDALGKIHGSNKVTDESMTGKYGLGFRANYHLTDNPHVLSGDRLYILDPHERLQGEFNGGGYFSLKEGDGRAYPDHFSAFEAADVNPDMAYIPKTIVRLPLRTPCQAERSEISTTSASTDDIRDIFKSFIADELGIVLLFLKNIKCIELVEVRQDGLTTGTIHATASLTKRPGSIIITNEEEYESETFLADYVTKSSLKPHEQSSRWRLYRRTYTRSCASKVLASRLPRSVEDLEADLKRDKLVANVGMAYRLDPGSAVNGRLFTLLPLPDSISPQIPIHLNCSFAVTSDRQHLKNMDHLNDGNIQKHREGLLAHWNKSIFDDFAPPAWAVLLTVLAQDMKAENRLDSIWSAFPLDIVDHGPGKDYWEGLLGSVLHDVLQKNLDVFPIVGGTSIQALRGAYLLDSKDTSCPRDALAQVGLRIIEAPSRVYEHLKSNCATITPLSIAKELRRRILQLKQCSDPEKDAILLYLLSVTNFNPDTVVELPLIPLISGKRVSLQRNPLTYIHVTQGLRTYGLTAWTKLGIPFLDQRIAYDKLKPFVQSLENNIGFLIRHIHTASIRDLAMQDWDAITESLITLRGDAMLSPADVEIYKQLPIFPIRKNLPENAHNGSVVATTLRGPIQGSHVYVESSLTCPIPSLLNHKTFIDIQIEFGLRRLLGDRSSAPLGELELLAMALENWENQPNYLKDRFLPRILARLADMPSSISTIQNLPFIPVGDRLLPPRDVVDPDSPIAGLYDDDNLPTGEFSRGSTLLDHCRRHRLLCQLLTPERLKDRIDWISGNASTFLPKALRLMEVLNLSWNTAFEKIIDECQSLSWVPSSDDTLVPPASCFFNDFPNHHEPSGRFGHAIPSSIPQSLAQRLKIPFLSSLKLGTDENEEMEEEEMSVELLSRIQAVLHDYDIKYAINEFLANAHDAGATEFSMMLDLNGYYMNPGELPISPACTKLLSQPALVLYNNAKFTQKDFKGILQIDKGGKLDNPDAIGRYGLGALSLFYFTDAVTVVSGDHVLMMDPSAEYLPRQKSGKKRTALNRTIESLARDSPSHLRPFHGKYNFQLEDSSYDGTMFRLPLHNGSSFSKGGAPVDPQGCRELLSGYLKLAQSAPLFTKFERIDASVRTIDGEVTSLWEVKATRECEQHGLVHVTNLTLLPQQEVWTIGQERVQIPQRFANTLPYRLKLRDSFSIGVAFSKTQSKKQHLLFSVLQLPSPISIPCHLNAPFSLPSSRRGIHFDPAGDSNRERSISDTEWNRWILSTVFPPLYLSCLSVLQDMLKNNAYSALFDYFPQKNPENNISREILQGFYTHLRCSPLPLLPTTARSWSTWDSAIFLSALPEEVNRYQVESVLSALQPKDLVLLPFPVRKHLSLAAFLDKPAQGGRPRIMSPAILREWIQSHASEIIRLYNSRSLNIDSLTTILQLLLLGGQSVTGLPLLFTGTNEQPKLESFPSHLSPVLHSDSEALRAILRDLAGPTLVLHPTMPTRCVDLLLRSSLAPIARFDESQALKLIQKRLKMDSVVSYTEDVASWAQRFCQLFDYIPGLRKATVLLSYPLIPTLKANEYISMHAYETFDRVVRYHPSIPRELVDALQEYGFLVVDSNSTHHFSFRTANRFSLTLASVLRGLQGLKRTGADFLKVPRHEALAGWIRETSEMEAFKEKNPVYQILANLPIWPSRKQGTLLLASARGTYCLPPGVDLFRSEIIAHYWEFLHPICDPAYSSKVKKLKGNELTISEILSKLRLPSVLPFTTMGTYATFLTELLSIRIHDRPLQSHIPSLKLPDGSGTMQPIHALYDSSVPIFKHAFGSINPTKFIHPLIRSNMESLFGPHLIHTVNKTRLLECLRAIDQVVQTSSEILISARVRQVYQNFVMHASSLYLDNRDAVGYSQIKALRFIVRANQRSSRATYDVLPYVGQGTSRFLPLIVSPAQVVKPELEGVAWTQRGVLDSAPPDILLSAMPDFGVPTMSEVAQHLRVLVDISKDHPRNPSLLQDLRDTYSWLNDRALAFGDQDVRTVFQAWSEDKLFLNVDDPTVEEWRWNSASEILINLHSDRHELGTYPAHRFICQYRHLLKSAGSLELKDVSYRSPSNQEVLRLPQVFNKMRRETQCTDMVLVPREEGWIKTSLPHLECHRVILEAAVPHLEGSRNSGMMESIIHLKSEYPIFGSPFCGEMLLDFVYKNDIKITKDHMEDMDSLLSELLMLLSIANQWEFDALKSEIGRIIVDELKLLDVFNHSEIRTQAEAYRATALLQACKEFESTNAQAIKCWENGKR